MESFLGCTATSVILGLLLALLHMYRNEYSRHFILTLVIMPAVVQMVIMLVNGNIGTGVAVMGAFGLVRFRSAPGNAREIGSIFLAMAIGLATGMGYIWAAVLFFVIIGAVLFLLTRFSFGEKKEEMELKITIPENLEYHGIFEDLLETYTEKSRLVKVKTSGMGSLYELLYYVRLRQDGKEKEFLDEIRCRNGNLSVSFGRIPSNREEL